MKYCKTCKGIHCACGTDYSTSGDTHLPLVGVGGLMKEISKDQVEGVKYDQGKVQLTLLNKEFLHGTAKAMMYGASKYTKNNYRNGMRWTRILDALLRHTVAFSNKEEYDEESKLSHLYHAGACLNMLLWLVENGKGEDDR